MSENAHIVWAVFHEPDAVPKALRRWSDAEVYAAEPPETMLHLPATVQSRLGPATVAAGALGGLLGGGLAALTGVWMGLEVGGLPLFPLPPIGIITFAIATLGAIAATLMFLLVKGRLLRTRLEVPEPARRSMTAGAVVVKVPVPAGERDRIAREIQELGAEVVQ